MARVLTIGAVLAAAPTATVIATHLEAVDHGTVSRASLRAFAQGLASDVSVRLRIPVDGETLVIGQ